MALSSLCSRQYLENNQLPICYTYLWAACILVTFSAQLCSKEVLQHFAFVKKHSFPSTPFFLSPCRLKRSSLNIFDMQIQQSSQISHTYTHPHFWSLSNIWIKKLLQLSFKFLYSHLSLERQSIGKDCAGSGEAQEPCTLACNAGNGDKAAVSQQLSQRHSFPNRLLRFHHSITDSPCTTWE